MAFNQRLKKDQYQHAYVLAIEHLFDLRPDEPYDVTNQQWVANRMSLLYPSKERPSCFYRAYIRPLWRKLQKYVHAVLDECIKSSVTILPNENEVWTLMGYVLAQTYADLKCPCHNRAQHLEKNRKDVCTLTIYSHTIGLNTLKLICRDHRKDELKQCSRCKCALYYSTEEQLADYHHHHIFCNRPRSWWHVNLTKRLLQYNKLDFKDLHQSHCCQ